MENVRSSRWVLVAALLGATSVVMGAMAAHYLPEPLMKLYEGKTHEVFRQQIPSAQKYMGDFETAAKYQMYHALALLCVGIVSVKRPSRILNAAGWFFLIGTLLFSGSLYVLVLTGVKWLGAITPFGGVALITGWLLIVVDSLFPPRSSRI